MFAHQLSRRRETGRSRRIPFRAELLEDRRLLAGVAVDTTFGTDGQVITDLSPAGISEDYVLDATMTGEKIVVVGVTDQTTRDWSVVRYNANGSIDTSFGQAGLARFHRGVATLGNAVAAQPDGKILVGGYSYETFGTSTQFAEAVLGRYNADGTLDASFGTGGIAVPPGAGLIRTLA